MTTASTDKTEFGATCSNGHWTALAVADGHLELGDVMPGHVAWVYGRRPFEPNPRKAECDTCGESLVGLRAERRHV
jgi:hypothetical protein